MRSFTALGIEEFVELVGSFPWTRQITEVHLHHTWLPAYEHYDGLRTIQGMWRHHTQVNGWSDIAQHASIGPDGTIWVGRNFNWSPASARGFNGNSSAGPFMIEMIGDFDIGKDEMTDEQRAATLAVIRSVQRHFELDADKLRFHNEMGPKTCPGEQIDKAQWIAAVADVELPQPVCDTTEAAFPQIARSATSVIADMYPNAAQTDNMAEAEHEYTAGNLEASEQLSRDAGREAGQIGSTSRELSAQSLALLCDHVINLTEGRLSDSGIISTSKGDVQRIINERVAESIKTAQAKGEKARILLYAHGGLTREKSALNAVLDVLPFWQANNIFPIFFVWETGLAETLKFMLRGARELEQAPRGMVREWLDERVEDLARAAGGDKIWSAMKLNAQLSSDRAGGATYVAGLLTKILKKAGDDAELHVAGHSAGAIFVAHLLSKIDAVPIQTAHFLAPAITNELFHEEVAPTIGNGINELTVYTMRKQLELADSVTPLYAKSLLYMVGNALEPRRPTPILGLEESIRNDAETAELFGLAGAKSGSADIVWSRSDEASTGNASHSRTHGDFDNDKATLESMCRRILGRRNGERISPYDLRRPRGSGLFNGPIDFPGDLSRYLASGAGTNSRLQSERGKCAGEPASPPQPSSGTPVPQPPTGSPVGRKRALCIGINDYPHISKLRCCVADAQKWSQEFGALGFEVDVVPQEEATSAGIKQRLEDFIGSARPGDQLAFQYAGHGTLIDDTSGDELTGKDACLCAWDCNNPNGDGGLVVDDDLFRIMNAIHPEAQLSGFIDCCHSQTMARTMFAPAQTQARSDELRRSVAPEPAMVAAYQSWKSNRTRARSEPGQALRAVFFNACQENEYAWEFDGSGHFTRIATALLARSSGLTNAEFFEQVLAGFGSASRQNPYLQADPAKRRAKLAIY